MKDVINLVRAQIDMRELEKLLGQLRALDNDLDQKMEDIRVAQQNVPVIDRINIFTNSDAEMQLQEENRIYKEIRAEHGQVVASIKNLIRTAIYQDFSVALKIQAGEIIKATSALRVEHKWGFGGKAHEYQIQGIATLRECIGQLSGIINTQYEFPPEPLNADELLNLVYDDVLRKGGFIV
ncbi:MAG TPA: hypothetical protein VI603_16860 [Saprospiraceae bacterium]|nr:hypothetical protein [Saprospiraceae bacterium]